MLVCECELVKLFFNTNKQKIFNLKIYKEWIKTYNEIHYIVHNSDILVTSLTDICAYRNIKVIILLFFSTILDLLEKNNIEKIFVEDLQKKLFCGICKHSHLALNYKIYFAEALVGNPTLSTKQFPLTIVRKYLKYSVTLDGIISLILFFRNV